MMSADNWTICPRCHEQYEKDLEAFERKVNESYGNVPPEEYIRLLSERAQLEEKQEPQTLREDYEQGIIEGEYYLRYSARCSKCGWLFSKRIDEKIYP
jgi:hypothetical protein